jgi:hypothetical protein
MSKEAAALRLAARQYADRADVSCQDEHDGHERALFKAARAYAKRVLGDKAKVKKGASMLPWQTEPGQSYRTGWCWFETLKDRRAHLFWNHAIIAACGYNGRNEQRNPTETTKKCPRCKKYLRES